MQKSCSAAVITTILGVALVPSGATCETARECECGGTTCPNDCCLLGPKTNNESSAAGIQAGIQKKERRQ